MQGEFALHRFGMEMNGFGGDPGEWIGTFPVAFLTPIIQEDLLREDRI